MNSVWDIAAAADFLTQQTELFTTANTVEIGSLLRYELDECTPICLRRVCEAKEFVEFARQQEINRTARPCSGCGVVGLDAVTSQAPEHQHRIPVCEVKQEVPEL